MMSRRRESKYVPTVSLKQHHTVKVNHVPLSVSKQQLKVLFGTHGSCEVHLRHQYGHKEQHAFVNYASHEAAQAAVKLNGTTLNGGKITVKLQGEWTSTAKGNCTVKVENLSKKTTEETLEEIFGFFGDTEVVSVKINTSANSPFNYAYVNYSSMQDAQRAVQELNGNKIHGSIVKVKIHSSVGTQSPVTVPFPIVQYFQALPPRPAFTHSRSRGPSVPPLLPIHHCTFGGLPTQPQHCELPTFPPPPLTMHGRFAIFPPPSTSYYGKYAIPPAEQPCGVSSKPPLSSTIKVTIHGHLTEDDLETIFDQFGTISTKPNVISGTPNFAYINFESPDQAQVAALTMDQQKIKGVKIDVKIKKDNRRPSAPIAPTSSHDYEQIDCALLVVQVITSADMPEYKLQLQEIESSTSVKVMPMKSGNGFNVSGKQEKLIEALSLLKDVISRAQEKLVEDCFAVPCHCVPLFTNQGTIKQITKIEQKHCVEFLVNDSGAQEAADISTFSRLVAVKFASHTDTPATVESVSRYLCASTSNESEQPGAHSADIWEWEDDDGKFKLYEPEKCEDFSLKFQQDPMSSFTCSIMTKLGLKEYSINFNTMRQTNISTGNTRQIKRQSMTCSALWYYTDDKGELVPYTKRQSCEIENAYRSGNKTLIMNINSKRYMLNFTQMKQTNILTVCERKISRKSTSSHVLNFRVRGLKKNLKQAVLDLEEELQAGLIKTSIALPSDSKGTFHSSLRELTDSYMVSASICDKVIHIEGVQGYIDKVTIKIREEKLSYERKVLAQQSNLTTAVSCNVPLPEYWDLQSEEIALKAVACGTKEWKDVETLMHASLPLVEIKTLERIQNKWLWDKYCFSKERMRQQNNGVINERELFHGTSTTPPEKIFKSRQGFDFRFCCRGMWGTGSYFAVNASYSDTNYAHSTVGGKQLILAKVLTGVTYKSHPDSSLKKPPIKNVKALLCTKSDTFVDERYDSVSGHTNGSDIYVIYDHEKAYPDYLITYNT